jgi:hypothetical protein
VIPGGPKLLDSWPAKGPKLLWKSAEKIPSDRDAGSGSGSGQGGCGSISVFGGKAFCCHYYDADRGARLHPTIMFRATPEKFEKLGVFKEPVAEFVMPTVAGGRMCLRLKDTIACYDLRAEGN